MTQEAPQAMSDKLTDHLVAFPRLKLVIGLAFLLLCVGASLAVAYLLQQSRATAENRATLESRNLARLADQSISRSVDAFDLVLKGVVYQLETDLRRNGRLDGAVINPLLIAQEDALAHSSGIRVADASGRVIFGRDVPPDSKASWGDRDFFARQRADAEAGLTVTDPIYGRVSKIWVISFARRYRAPDGSFGGVVSIAIPVDYFQRLLGQFDTGPEGIVLLRDSRARLIARFPESDHPNARLGADRFSPELASAIASGEDAVTFHATLTADAIERISTYRRLKNAPFHLVAGRGANDYLEPWRQLRTHALAGLASFVVATGLALWLLWRAAERMKFETERSGTLLKNASDGIHVLDAEGRLVDASDAFCRMLGRSREALLGKTLSAWITREALGDAELRLERDLASTGTVQFETRHLCANGETVDVEISGTALVLQGRRLMFYSARDVSAKLRDARDLQESEQRFRTLFESSPDPVWIIDNYQFVECNHAAVALLGYPGKTELLGAHPSRLSPPIQPDGEESFGKAQRMMDLAFERGAHRFEWEHTRFDGSTFIAEVTLSAIGLRGRRVIHCQWRDITQEKQAQRELSAYRDSLEALVETRTEELGRQRRQLEIILNSIPGAVAYWERTYVNRFANPTYEEWLGQETGTVEGRDMRAVLPPALFERIRPRVEGVFAGESQHFMVPLKAASNDRRDGWAEVHYVPDQQENQVVGFFVLAFDVTDLTSARDATEAASRAKSMFLANMSHELRTPMNGVLGMIALARRRMADPKGLVQLDKAKLSAERLLHVLNDILDLSKIEADRLVLEHTRFTLASVMDGVQVVLRPEAERSGLPLRIELPSVLRARSLLGDPLRLGQVLTNLASNAIKFSQRGEIVIRTRLESETANTATLHFEVEDSGIGIRPEDQERLFTPFEQADGSTTRMYGGTGLGLAICRRLVELMHGTIGVTSTPGVGSVFAFTAEFDLAADALGDEAVPAGHDAEQVLRDRFAGLQVLVAEDEPVNQEVVSGLLSGAGLTVQIAENGDAAVTMARETEYALILMDMQMPGRNGIDATHDIRHDSRNRETPIVALTANAFDTDRARCLAAGMNDHVAKPIDPNQLFETVRSWLERAMV
ncbi:MAG: PAS domain S-box protein [Rhodocyclaceae bacterium]|nr:PAS domain S-box protein [Rhodocyclaceae bacterium]